MSTSTLTGFERCFLSGCYLAASAVAAVINFPLWKASAIAQAGFAQQGAGILGKYWQAVQPPYRGVAATIGGFTWARGAIFWGSDVGREYLREAGFDSMTSTVLPPLVVSTLVQIINMPLIRGTITIQDPNSPHKTVTDALTSIHRSKGVNGLWHGTSAGILKTVPKYCTAVCVKDWVEDLLNRQFPRGPQTSRNEELMRSAMKSISAGLAGAILTNPLDVLRNEMFKTDLSMTQTLKKLQREEGVNFMGRGIGKNLVAVAIPIAVAIFMTDVFVNLSSMSSRGTTGIDRHHTKGDKGTAGVAQAER